MSERKVLNKYIPPDFDPSALKRVKNKDKTGPKQQTVRLMTPFSMRCNACGEYIYKGKKFNARKEDTLETYYSVKIYRFHIKCTRCSTDITFRTDPKNADYKAESGAQRNFEPWRTEEAAENDNETELDKLEEEENVMEALESKTMDAKNEMEIADALDEIRTRNAALGRVSVDTVLERLERDKLRELEVKRASSGREQLEQQDRDLAKAVFSGEHGAIVRRLRDDDDDDDNVDTKPRPPSPSFTTTTTATTSNTSLTNNGSTGIKFAPHMPKKRDRGSLLGVKVVKRTKLI